MKNTINYYYNLLTNDIHQNGLEYYFTINKEYYLFIPFYGNLNQINDIYQYLKEQNIYCHEIIENKDHQILTNINNQYYILLKDYVVDRNLNINDITNYSIYIDTKEKNNWFRKWCDKLDYYEYQIEQNEQNYPCLYESFFYYDGLTELAISLLNSVDLRKINQYISHQRINKKPTIRELYNPVNMIIDTRVRDSAEYFKNVFFYDHNPINEIVIYLSTNQLSYEEAMLFLIRMLYPSYYFDFYDDIINGKKQDSQIQSITSKASLYEQLLAKIYHIIGQTYLVPEIEMLKKT